ncbi:hypothetical protein LguiB_001987 [Lonicera macranthoides]
MRPPLTHVYLVFKFLLANHYCCLLCCCSTSRPIVQGQPLAKRTIFLCGQSHLVFVFIFSCGSKSLKLF